jgi:hypothetical protein
MGVGPFLLPLGYSDAGLRKCSKIENIGSRGLGRRSGAVAVSRNQKDLCNHFDREAARAAHAFRKRVS